MPRLFVIAVFAAGCSYTPVADLRVCGDKAQLYQRDVVECRQLVVEALSSLQVGGSKVINVLMIACGVVGIACWGFDMVKDAIGMLVLTVFVIVFCTNAVTSDYNLWALMVRFGG